MKHRKDLERTGNTLGKVKNPPPSEVDKYMKTHQSVKSPKPTYTDNVIHKFNLVTRGMADVYSLGTKGILKKYLDRGGYKGLYSKEETPKTYKRTDVNYIDASGNYVFKKRPKLK